MCPLCTILDVRGILGILFVMARLIMIIEPFISMRKVSAGFYVTVQRAQLSIASFLSCGVGEVRKLRIICQLLQDSWFVNVSID
jgi:hypothetical protein